MISSEAYNFECFSNFQFKMGVTQIFKSNLANLYISRACRLLCSAVLHLNLSGHVNFYKQSRLRLPYFFPYKLSFFIQNNPKNLDLLDCIGRVRLVLYSKIDLLICSHSREGKSPSYIRINTVAWELSRVEIFHSLDFS